MVDMEQEENRFFWVYLIMLGVMAIVVSYPFFSMQTTPSNHGDLLFHLNRIEGIKDGLLAGQFPVRIHAYQLDGYGYPVGIFYPDLFLYPAAFLRLLGVRIEGAYNFLCIMSNIMTVYSSWYAFSRFSRSYKIGAISAVLYTICSYHIIEIYVRSALGEKLAMAFFPLVLVMMWEIIYKDEKKWPVFVVAFTCIIQAHILTTLLTILCILVMIILGRKELIMNSFQRGYVFLKAIFCILGLNLWFFVPFIDFYTGMEFSIKHEHRSMLAAALPFWEFHALYFIGIPMLCSVYLFIRNIKLNKEIKWSKKYNYLFFVGLFFVWMSTDAFPWQTVLHFPVFGELLQKFQFPWRFLMITSFCWSISGGIALNCFIENSASKKYIAILGGIFCLVTIGMIQEYQVLWGSTQYQTLPSFGRALGVMRDYLYEDITEDPIKNQKIDLNALEGVSNFSKRGTTIKFLYASENSSFIMLPLLYYPGYMVQTSDECDVLIRENAEHLLYLEIPSGTRWITICYVGRRIYQICDVTSMIFCCVFLVYVLKRLKQKV